MTQPGKIPIWVKHPTLDLEFLFYPTPEQFSEIAKVMKQGKTRDEAAMIVMNENYKPGSSEDNT